MTNHLGIIGEFKKAHVAVIGDLMLDKYCECLVERRSPEGPCLVAVEQDVYHRAGGSGNACMNITSLGSKCSVFGVVGGDVEGGVISHLLANAGCYVNGICGLGLRTNCKTRFMAEGHHLLRYDTDRSVMPAIREEIVSQVIDALVEDLSDDMFSSVLISDYDKGLFDTERIMKIIGKCHESNIPVIADPKYRNFMSYVGVDVLKCNLKEAAMACDKDPMDVVTADNICALCEDIVEMLGCKSIIVTRGKNGMSVLSGGVLKHIPAQRVEISELSGAGDTVAAVIAICLGIGMNVFEAARIANVAAALVVGKSGTASVAPTELANALKNLDS